MTTQAKKGSKKGLFIFIALLLIVGVVLLVVFLPKKAQPYAVMEMDINPKVQFVLDTDDNIVHINYINEDAETLLSQENFVGMNIKEVATKFVDLCITAGYMDINTTGDTVDITIYCENSEKVADLCEDIKAQINEYFDENGIIAGAITHIRTNFEQAYENISTQYQDFIGMTQDEILTLIEQTSEDLKDISITLRSELFSYIEQLKNHELFQDIPRLEDYIEYLQDEIENSPYLTDEIKDEINAEIDSAQQELDQLLDDLQTFIDEKIAELRQLSQEIFKQTKQLLNQKIEQTKQTIEEHKQYFEQHKDEILAKIEQFRQSL